MYRLSRAFFSTFQKMMMMLLTRSQHFCDNNDIIMPRNLNLIFLIRHTYNLNLFLINWVEQNDFGYFRVRIFKHLNIRRLIESFSRKKIPSITTFFWKELIYVLPLHIFSQLHLNRKFLWRNTYTFCWPCLQDVPVYLIYLFLKISGLHQEVLFVINTQIDPSHLHFNMNILF